MTDINGIKLAVSKIQNEGVDKFLKSNSILDRCDIEGVFHYDSLLPVFAKFILFDFSKKKEISLIFANEFITLADFCKKFSTHLVGYDFREDISRIDIDDVGYIMIEGKVDLRKEGTTSTDARGNIKSAKEIRVKAIVMEVR